MKNKFLLFILVCIFIFSCTLSNQGADYKLLSAGIGIGTHLVSSLGNDDDERLKKEFKVKPGKTLDVGLDAGGSINIIGWNEDKLTAEFEFPDNDREKYDITFNETESGIEIFSDLIDEYYRKGGNIKLEIRLPRNFNLSLETKGGNVIIQSVNGEISGKTYGGNLSFKEINGNIDFKTYGGNIDLQNSKVNGWIETMGGNLHLRDVEGDVSGKTMGGNVRYDNVKTSSKGKPIELSTMGGTIDLDNALSGSVLYTAGGNIEVGSAKEFVKAKTMGGNIRIEEVDGGVEASTMGGEIYVKLIEKDNVKNRDVDISTMSGDITVLIPAGYSCDIDAEINDDDGYYEILSDFELKKSGEDDVIHAEGSINGGKYKISVRTHNGNIYLKKV